MPYGSINIVTKPDAKRGRSARYEVPQKVSYLFSGPQKMSLTN